MATPQRDQAYGLFSQLVTEALVQIRKQNLVGVEEEAKQLTRILWPFVSTDDQIIVNTVLALTQLRDGTLYKKLTRTDIIKKCDELLTELRNEQELGKQQN